ncbi:MFS transporter, partial [Streptomyces sp. SID7982]|nr:MFS transporter [Streptomyces sp. SID7982]
PLAVTMLLGGIAGGVLNPILTTVIYERVPDRLRSRVSGALTAGCEFAMPVGGLAAGLLVEGAGATGALLAMGGVYFLATLSPLVFPSWRTLDDVPGAEPVQKPVPQAEAPAPAPAAVSSSGPSRPTPGP